MCFTRENEQKQFRGGLAKMKVSKNLLFRCKVNQIFESVNFVETNLIKHVRIVIFTMQSDLYEGGLSMNIL